MPPARLARAGLADMQVSASDFGDRAPLSRLRRLLGRTVCPSASVAATRPPGSQPGVGSLRIEPCGAVRTIQGPLGTSLPLTASIGLRRAGAGRPAGVVRCRVERGFGEAGKMERCRYAAHDAFRSRGLVTSGAAQDGHRDCPPMARPRRLGPVAGFSPRNARLARSDADMLAASVVVEGCVSAALHVERRIVGPIDGKGLPRAVCVVGTRWWSEEAARTLVTQGPADGAQVTDGPGRSDMAERALVAKGSLLRIDPRLVIPPDTARYL